MLLESLIEAKVPCEVLIPPPGPGIPRLTRPKVGVLVSMGSGSALQPPPPPLLAGEDSSTGGTLSAFVAPGAARRGSGSGSFDRRTAGSMGAEGPGRGEGGVLRKSSARTEQSLTVDTRGVDRGSPRDGGDGTNVSRMLSSSSSSSSPPPSSFQPVAGGGSGRLVDGRGGGSNAKPQGELHPARRMIGQAFRPGELECECRYSRRFPLYHRLRPKEVLSTLAISSLEMFRVRGRSGLYVCPDKEGDVFYMTLMEVRLNSQVQCRGRFVASSALRAGCEHTRGNLRRPVLLRCLT